MPSTGYTPMQPDRLIFEQGTQAGQVVVLSDHALVLGRATTADVVIDNNDVSRQHLRLTPESGAYRVEDLKSLNGTFVNDVRLKDSQLLVNGDRVRLGPTVVLRLELAPTETLARPPAFAIPKAAGPGPAEHYQPGWPDDRKDPDHRRYQGRTPP